MSLNIIGPVNKLGYGVVTTNLVNSLLELNVNVSLFPVRGNVDVDERYQERIKRACLNGQKYDKNADCVRIWHQFDLKEFVGHGAHVGFPIFELESFTKNERHDIENVDKLFVCSNWAKTIVENRTTQEKIYVVSLGVNSQIFWPKKSTRKDTIFINIGKWEIRKGHDLIYKAFEQAFSPDDNVQLWMLNNNPFYSPEENQAWANLYKNTKMGHKTVIFPAQGTQDDIANIMREVDCGIFPARAEGWNLEILELMSCGKPSIVSNYSGHTEFCNSENSYLFDIDGLEDAYDGKWFHNQGKWASIGDTGISKIIDLMRKVHLTTQSPERYNMYGACVETAQKFSWKNSAEKLLEGLL